MREPFADRRGLKGMRMLVPAAALLLVLLTAACGAGEPGAVGGSTGATDDAPPPTVPAPDPEQLYEADATVLEDASHGPELCLGAVAASLPPQCGGVPIANWDWDAVEGEQSAAATTWGEFHVVGTYDGEAFTATQIGPASYDQGPSREFTTSCPEPQGGWETLGSGLVSDEDFSAGAAVAQSRPGFVALWVDYVGDHTPEELDQLAQEGKPVLQIMNVVVTDDVVAHEEAIRKHWEGPLCVTQREGHTQKELQRIRAEAEQSIQEDLGLEYLWSAEGAPELGEAAEVRVVIDVDGAAQAILDERYGPGVVRLVPALTPADE
jgi:hypothetical protein